MSFEIALQRMPHRGEMLLIETVLEADEDSIRCQAKPHQTPHYPLRVDDKLPATALVELGAQAAAAHASLHGVGAAHVGLLLTLSGVEIGTISPDAAPDGLHIYAWREHGDKRSARYRFEVQTMYAETLLSGNAVLSMAATT